MKKSIAFTVISLCLSLYAGAQTTFQRISVVEELTGTRCGWCPRGLVGMQKLRQEYGDRFIGIGVHNFSTADPMYSRPYAAAGVFDASPGAPTCTIDRHGFCDPLHGTTGDVCADFLQQLNQPCYVGVSVSGSYNADSTLVESKATITAGRDMQGLSVVFVLVADSVFSDDNAFLQYNAYATKQAADLPNDPELHPFCKGGTYGYSPFKWAFDDVCIGVSYNNNGKNQAEAVPALKEGQTFETAYRMQMPTKAVLKRTFSRDRVSIVAMVIAADGTVANAARQPVTGFQTAGIVMPATHHQGAAAVYDLTGRRDDAANRYGLRILILPDGQVRKVLR